MPTPDLRPFHLDLPEALVILKRRIGADGHTPATRDLQASIANTWAPIHPGDLVVRKNVWHEDDAVPLGAWLPAHVLPLRVVDRWPNDDGRWGLDTQGLACMDPSHADEAHVWDDSWVRVEENGNPEATPDRKFYTVALRCVW